MFNFNVTFSKEGHLVSHLGDITVIIGVFDDSLFMIVGDGDHQLIQDTQYYFE